jgi:hypothetical protein
MGEDSAAMAAAEAQAEAQAQAQAAESAFSDSAPDGMEGMMSMADVNAALAADAAAPDGQEGIMSLGDVNAALAADAATPDGMEGIMSLGDVTAALAAASPTPDGQEGIMSMADVEAALAADAATPDGQEGMMSMADVNAALAAEGLTGNDGGFAGANDTPVSGEPAPAVAAPPAYRAAYTAADGTTSTPSSRWSPAPYKNYGGLPSLVADYGRNVQSPFGEFVNPFYYAPRQYYRPEYQDYGLAGLRR